MTAGGSLKHVSRGSALLLLLACAGCESSLPAFLRRDGPNQLALESAAEVAPATVAREQFEHGNFGLAEVYFRQAVERDPGNVDLWIGLGASYDQLKKFDLADRAYQTALRIGGRLPGTLNNLGYSYFLRGEDVRALPLLREASRLDPGNAAIGANLALILHGSRRVQQ